MGKNNINMILFDKLSELNKLEITRTKILTAIFIKTVEENVDRKLQALEENFYKQAELCNQDLLDYHDICSEIMKKYQNQLNEVIEQYNEMFINLQMELQESECDQKIAIIDFKKSFNNNKANKYFNKYMKRENNRKINACIQKKYNFDVVIEECEKELDKCTKIVKEELNNLFGDQLCKMLPHKEIKGVKAVGGFFGKIKNIFVGKSKFNQYCIEPINLEIKVMEENLPDIKKNIYEQSIKTVSKIRQMKSKTKKIYNKMI